MKPKKDKTNIFLLAYYLLLVLVLLSWKDPDNPPAMSLRLIYLGLSVFPFIFIKHSFSLFAIPCLFSISMYGYAFTYMPTDLNLYVIVVLVAIFINRKKLGCHYNPPNLILFFCCYTLCVNILTSGKIDDITYSLLLIFLLSYLLPLKNIDELLTLMTIGFVVVSIALSIQFLFGADQFTQAIGNGMERIGWKDPNYFGNVVGMGTIASIIEFKRNRGLSVYLKAVFIFSIVVSTMVLALNASRGAMLSIGVGLFVLIYLTDIKLVYKVIITLLIVGLVIYLYDEGYFDLLLYRIENDDSMGSGRGDIWKKKLLSFSETCSTFEWIFGVGIIKGFMLAFTGGGYGFHNDFIAFLVCYGFVGLMLFLSILLYPLAICRKKMLVLGALAYLSLSCFTLEPLTAGRLTYWVFYLYILFLAKSLQKNEKNSFYNT